VRPLQLTCTTLTSCLGRGLDATLAALRSRASGLAPCRFETAVLDTCVGEVAGVDEVRLAPALGAYDCRNNRLAALALAQDGFADAVSAAAARLGARRIGVFLGTSTSGILQTELAYRRRDAASGALPADFDYQHTHNTGSVSDFVRRSLGLAGPTWTVSTACSSSAKVFGTAARMIEAGLIDAAVVGGVDSLCLTTLYGFNSLELLSHGPCRPYDAARTGLSIGEGAAFALLEPRVDRDAIALLGVGESSDAHHMSAPHPEGLGAQYAMRDALARGGIDASEVGYLNLHGTATPANDRAEAIAVDAIFNGQLHASSTKGWTGHTLGAAGIVESVIALLALESGEMPGTLNSVASDPICGPQIRFDNARTDTLRYAMNNSFGFGGNNCALLFGRTP